ncbi:hypothetical protein FNF29_08372 [Cafeteria roenbergensis]|uniref:Uncharacterized protein n=1 Tax=Cafeteria roenbergensis TaxID=33653 RepID=A0A5A8BYQ8_CAFRO|nr:hypothetical protein FNF29_08372 [Cafeteria roenbergensis]|eukprot:KAA0145836.1 hypothetical protein FNF29_08372 [Cafeteria roenbergensis]
MVLHDSTGGARSVVVRSLSSAASETDSHPFSTDAKQGAAGHLPRESARRDAVGLALGTLSLSSVSPEVARARVELGQDHFQFIVEMAAAKGLRSDDNENIVELLGRLGTASIELAHCTDIDAVLQRARVTLAMPGVEAQLAKWHRLGHLQSVAGGFAEVMAKPSTIATVQDHARKLLLEAEEQAEKQAEKAKREAEEKAEKAKREAEEEAEKAKREAEEEAEKAKREAEEKGKRDSFVAAMNALVKYSSSYRQSGELADYDELQASKLAWKSLRTAQSDRRLSLFLGTQQRTELVSAVFEGVFDLAFRERRLTTTNVKFLSGPKGSGKTTLVWKAAKAAVEAIPRSRVADVVVVKLDGSSLQSVFDARHATAAFVPHPVACVQFALWQAGLLRDTELERKMESNPWDPLCWEDVFGGTIQPASSTPGRKVRVFLIVDEFQELFRFAPLGRRFRTQLTALMNGLEDFETFVMGSPTVGRQVLLNPRAMQDDASIKVFPGLKGQVDSVNITKISQPARLNRFSGDEAVHFVLSCLPEQQESTLSDIPGIVNELRGKLHAEPPAIAEQLDKLRQCPAWKRLTSVFDGLQPTARRLVESFVHTERSDATWDPIAKMEQAEAIAFWQAVAQPVAKLLVTGFATVPVGTAPQSVSWALGASMLPLLNTDFKELSQQRGVVDDARVAADALVDQGVLRQSLDDKFGLSSNFMRLLSLSLLDETGSCGLHPRQVLAMLDATGASGEAMELLAAKGICETGPGAFLRQCMDSQPHLPTYQAAEDASSSISGWLNDLKSATVTAKGQDARPASETSADSAVGPSEAAMPIAVQLLPSLDLKASDGGQPLPLDKFFKEKPDRFGADAVAVVELSEEDGPKTRHIIRVQVKVSSDTDEQKALSTGGVATILQQMNDSFRDDGSSEPKTSLLQSVLTSQTEGLACIVVWNCLVTCKKTTNGVPVYVVPVVADHEVMLDMWPARVKQFASATGIRNYSKPRP